MWGVVKSDGKVISGAGFIVEHIGPGIYTVVFRRPFTVIPAVVTSELYPNDVHSSGGDTRDNSVVVGIDLDRFRVKLGDGGGTATDRDFTFIAIGS